MKLEELLAADAALREAERRIALLSHEESSRLRREGLDAARREAAKLRGSLGEWDRGNSSLSPRRRWVAGERVCARLGWHERTLGLMEVLGPAVLCGGQWWVPVKTSGSEDPDFFKEAGLEDPR